VYGDSSYEAALKAAGFKQVRKIEFAPNSGEQDGAEYCRAPLEIVPAGTPLAAPLISMAIVIVALGACIAGYRRRRSPADGGASERTRRVSSVLGALVLLSLGLWLAWPILRQLGGGYFNWETVSSVGIGALVIVVGQLVALRRITLSWWFWIALSLVSLSAGIAIGTRLIGSTLLTVVTLPEGMDLEFRTVAAGEILADAFRCVLFGSFGALGALWAGLCSQSSDAENPSPTFRARTQGPLAAALALCLGAALLLWLRAHALDEAFQESHFDDRAQFLAREALRHRWFAFGTGLLVLLTQALGSPKDPVVRRSFGFSAVALLVLAVPLAAGDVGARGFTGWFRDVEHISLLSVPEGIPKAKNSPPAKLGPAYVLGITKTSFVDFDHSPISLGPPPAKPPRVRPDSVPALIVERTTTYAQLEGQVSKWLGQEKALRLLLSRGESKFDVAWAPPPKPALGSIRLQVMPKLEDPSDWSQRTWDPGTHNVGLPLPPIWFALDGASIRLFAENLVAELKIGVPKQVATEEITRWLKKSWSSPPVLVAFVTPTSNARDIVDAVATLVPTLPFGDGPEPRFSKLVITSDRTSVRRALAQAQFELHGARMWSPSNWFYCPKGCTPEILKAQPW
jgi:hypothetical protein